MVEYNPGLYTPYYDLDGSLFSTLYYTDGNEWWSDASETWLKVSKIPDTLYRLTVTKEEK